MGDRTLIALSNALGYIAEIQSYDPYSNDFAIFCRTELGIEFELLKKVREIGF
jgi:hypothetical protein